MKLPGISIIIPIFNVEEYITDTLQAIANQSFKDFEVIMIDDGSSDDSPSIAKGYSAKDPRFNLIQKKNEGVSIARNTGIRQATGRYLFFVDADDLIPLNALEELFKAAEAADSDVVTGKLMHLRNDEYTTVRMSEIVFSDYKRNTTLAESPKLVFDTITCGKLIRKSYWDKVGAVFPERLSYCEDMPVSFRLYSMTDKITMLDKEVYYWRVRDGSQKSATQKKSLQMIRERLTSLRMINEFIAGRGISCDIIREKKIKTLLMDFNILVNKIVEMDEETMHKAMALISGYMKEDDLPSEFHRIPAIYAEKYKAVLNDDCDRLKKLRDFQTDISSCIKVRKCGRMIIGIFPSDIMPFGIADMRSTIDTELLRQGAKSVDVSEEGIVITGCAYVRYLPVRKPEKVRMEAWIKDDARNKVKPVTIEQCTTTIPFGREKKVNSNRVAYAGTGYKIILKKGDVDDLPSGEYRLFIEWTSAGKKGESTIFPFTDSDIEAINKAGLLKANTSIKTTARKEPVLLVQDL